MTQYGSGFKVLSVYLNQKNFIPLERVSEFCAEVFAHPVGEGTIVSANAQVTSRVELVNEQAKQYLMTTDETLHFDESGLQVTQKLHWVYAASTERVTCYHIDPKRGHEGIEQAGILPHRTGNCIHNDSPAYYGYTVEAHAACHRHHLRELAFLQKRYPQPWQPALAKLLAKINQAIATAKAAGLTELTPAQITAFETRYTELVDQGLQLNPAATKSPGQRGRVKQTPPNKILSKVKIESCKLDFE